MQSSLMFGASERAPIKVAQPSFFGRGFLAAQSAAAGTPSAKTWVKKATSAVFDGSGGRTARRWRADADNKYATRIEHDARVRRPVVALEHAYA
jgi:hypothetical protein